MRYYISRKPMPEESVKTKNLDVEFGKKLIRQFYKEVKATEEKLLAFDTETNGLDAYMHQVLLVSIGDEDTQFVIDATTVDLLDYLPEEPDDFEWICQNGKFDQKMMIVGYDYHIIKMFDIMLAQQKLYQGSLWNPKDNPTGARVNLPAIVASVLKIDAGMDKSTRNEFIGVRPQDFRGNLRNVDYSGKDLVYLHPIRKKQYELLRRKKIWYMDEVGLYVSYATAHIELTGFRMHKEQWRETIKKRKAEAFQHELNLDRIFKELRELRTPANKLLLVGGKYDRVRNPLPHQIYTDLFGNEMDADKYLTVTKKRTVKSVEANTGKKQTTVKLENKGCINWSSSDAIAKIFGILRLSLPVAEDKRVFEAIPEYRILKQKIMLTSMYKFTTKADNLEQLLLENPDHPAKEFFQELILYRGCQTAINSFGENFLSKINPVTGRIHTIYRIDTAATGRYQSGEKNSMYPNFQNIPRDSDYRTAFLPTSDEYSIITADLSGAEVTIMCDKAHDEQLYEWAVKNDDAHSPIATACWKMVYLWRLCRELGLVYIKEDFIRFGDWYWREEITSYITGKSAESELHRIFEDKYKHYDEFVITKQINKSMRQDFKNTTFAMVYNVGVKKLAKMLNITFDEAYIIQYTTKSTIPATFAMVEHNAWLALNNGSLRLNTRTGCRIMFPPVLNLLKEGKDLSQMRFMDKVAVEGAARNAPIQGTQADMMKEAVIEAVLYWREYKVNARCNNTVHDERVSQYLTKELGQKLFFWCSDKIKKKYQPNLPLFLPVRYDLKDEILLAGYSKEDVDILTPEELEYKFMTVPANRYLEHYTMGSSIDVNATWVK